MTFPFPIWTPFSSNSSISFVTSTSLVSSTSVFTFNNTQIGAAATGRRVIIGVGLQSLTVGATFSSLTIGGVSALQAGSASENAGGVFTVSAFYALQVDAGATANIVVTTNSAVIDTCFAVWSGLGLQSSTATDFKSSVADTMTATLNVNGNGVGAGFVLNSGSVLPTHTWSGLTENVDTTIGGSSAQSGASNAFAAATAVAIVCTPTTTSSNVMVVAAYA